MLKMNIRQLLGVVAFLTFFSGGAIDSESECEL